MVLDLFLQMSCSVMRLISQDKNLFNKTLGRFLLPNNTYHRNRTPKRNNFLETALIDTFPWRNPGQLEQSHLQQPWSNTGLPVLFPAVFQRNFQCRACALMRRLPACYFSFSNAFFLIPTLVYPSEKLLPSMLSHNNTVLIMFWYPG